MCVRVCMLHKSERGNERVEGVEGMGGLLRRLWGQAKPTNASQSPTTARGASSRHTGRTQTQTTTIQAA